MLTSVLAIYLAFTQAGFSQIVQLPSTGTFSLQTSVLVPDSGSAYLGGNQRDARGSRSLGPSLASGSAMTSSSAMVRATIIDLNELDTMIRSQAGTKPVEPDLVSNRSQPSKYASTVKGSPSKNADYEYLAAMSHPTDKKDTNYASSDTTYYLALARNATQNRHWAAVELYYKLAWESLPVARRESVSRALLEARSKPVVDPLKNPKSGEK